MNKIRLTRDADFLICVLYDAYCQRRKNGESRFDAKIFGGSDDVQTDYVQSWSTDDIDDAARELDRNDLVSCVYGDDTVCNILLQDEGISYMENRFGDNMEKLVNRLADLRRLILG